MEIGETGDRKSNETLFVFSPERYWAFSKDAPVSQLPIRSEALDPLAADKPLLAQIQVQPDTAYGLDSDHALLLLAAEPSHYSTSGVPLVRFGSLASDHVRLAGTSASFALAKDSLRVMDDDGVYLNGRKIAVGEHATQTGDCIWAGATQITLHGGYLECRGVGYLSSLNVATQNPRLYEEFPIYKRSPRLILREPTDQVELNHPPSKEEPKKGTLVKIIVPPLVSAAMTVGFGILMGRGIMMMLSAGMTVVTIANSIFTFFSERKARREKEEGRIEDYGSYLLAKRKELHKLKEAQRKSLLYHNPAPREIEREIMSNSSRVYERASSDSDFLTLSLGLSDSPTSYKVRQQNATENKRDPLLAEMREVASLHQTLKDVPAAIDLKNAHLGLVGEKPYIHSQIKSIIAQLCFFQSYHDIEVILLIEEEHRADFEWTRWYPHCRMKSINVTGLISAENHRDQALGNIAQVLKQRQQKAEEAKKDSRYLPHYVFIVDNPKLIVNHSIMEYLQTPETALGFSLVYSTNIQANLPENIKTVLRLDGGENATLIMNEGNLVHRPLKLHPIDGIKLEVMARKLASLRHLQGISTQIPESVTFFDLYKVKRPEEIPVLELWARNACHKSLAVPLGLRGKDDVVSLNLHESAHGPHGLVAGTTGSGKSEIVQSYILSLAINFHPHEVGFLLIDYKGGGMANLFADLPHLLGTITNLDGSESMRALTSIKSELARRQRVFNEQGVNSINQYTKLFKAGEATLPLPHLFIISDEFAELKKEQPDFMAELVSTARIGRSLGVHLILATQKPSGVVDDQIWSNSKFKLALKVANESDSKEVLKTPDAARITQPGRAYLQVGNNEIYELFQSAWSGAPFVMDVAERGFDGRVYLINRLGQGVLLNEDLSEVDKTKDAKSSELEVMVSHIRELYDKLDAAYVERPWLPPLEEKIVTSAIKAGHDVGKIEGYHFDVPLGMVDIPEQQEQREFCHNFAEGGNVAVFGASGFGKSTAILTVTLTLASKNSPRNCKFFVFDYGNAAISHLRGLPHTADYLTIDDAEKLDKVTRLILDEIKRRKRLFAKENAVSFRMYNEVAKDKIPAVFLIVDNFDVVREAREDLEEMFKAFTRDGPSVGIYAAITATRSHSVKYSIISNFKNKIALFMADKAECTTIVGRTSFDLPEIRGRALARTLDVHVAQIYLPVAHENDIDYARDIGEMVAKIAERNSAGKADGVRVLPETVYCEDIAKHFDRTKRIAVIGFDTETTEPVSLDLTIPFQVVAGGPSTGKTNLLRILLVQFAENIVFVSDSGSQDLAEFDGAKNVVYMSGPGNSEVFIDKLKAEADRLKNKRLESGLSPREFIAAEPPTLVLIDDADAFVERTKDYAAELEPLMKLAAEHGAVFVATTIGAKLRGYDPVTALFKNPQSALVLGSPEESAAIVNVKAQRGYKPAPELAFYLKRGNLRQVKLPFVNPQPL